MMDEFGEDAPEVNMRSGGFVRKPNPLFSERKYLPTLADLIDRLTIVILKQINIPENREAYDKERGAILHDIRLLWNGANFTIPANAVDVIEATVVVMLANKTIWDNESKARLGGSEQDHLLKFTHSINGCRNRAKNVIAKASGERLDFKVDSFAADIPPEFGAWENII